MITREIFTELIMSLRDQKDYDFAISEKLGVVYGSDMNPYDTTRLTESILGYLSYCFPDKIGEIKNFCYEMDYGRHIETYGCPIKELWVSLEPYMRVLVIPEMDKTHEEVKASQTTTSINDIEVTYAVVSPLPNRKFSIEDE